MPTENSPLLPLMLMLFCCAILYPSQSNSYSSNLLVPGGSHNLGQEFPEFSLARPNMVPAQTIMPPNYPSSGMFLPTGIARGGQKNPRKRAENFFMPDHNATHRSVYPWPSLPYPAAGNRISGGQSNRSGPWSQAYRGNKNQTGERYRTQPNEDQTVPASTTQTPLPLASWLLSAAIFTLMGFSRKPC